jgi:hypothetical protein
MKSQILPFPSGVTVNIFYFFSSSSSALFTHRTRFSSINSIAKLVRGPERKSISGQPGGK